MKVLLSGSVAYDYLMTFPGYFREHILPDQLESLSLSFLVSSLVRRRGGIAPNIAYTMALLGERPAILATVGEDFEEYRAFLEQVGVETRYIKVIPGETTASFFANTDLAQAQIASFYPGAMAHAASLSIAALDERPDLVVVSPDDPQAMRKRVQECKELGIPYFYDPSQQTVRFGGEELLEGVDGAAALFCNEYEFALIQQKTGLSAEDIRRRVPLVVVTQGEKGTTIAMEGEEIHVPAVPPRQVVDPTGVGDAFRGGFLKGYLHGLPLDLAGRLGALAATYCLEAQGPQGHTYTREEFLARFREAFGEEAVQPIEAILTHPDESLNQETETK